jgi:hypothetical protein
VAPGIRINSNDPAYIDAVVQDFATMNDTNAGHAMIRNMGASGRTATVQAYPSETPANAYCTPTNPTTAGDGTGSDSTVQYNPTDWPDPTTPSKAPGDVLLFHEMTHAENNANGVQDNTPRTDNFDNQEEFNTIGPENRYRDERGVPRRHDHHDL